ncbi:MAG: ATPase [marine bacterium B5-7]|nr:MAG: ATPase [marine bacterium B5-7]
MKKLLSTLLHEAFDEIEQARKGIPRSIRFPQSDQIIKVAIGMRRSGKTYTLYQQIHHLLDQGIAKERILFLDFEDDRLLPMTTKKMGELIDAFYSIYPENHQRKCYLFLDEVQVVENWHQVVRRIFKSKPIELVITGSSSKLLSTEINTSLRGRSLSAEVLPYSFSEYRLAHHLQTPNAPFSQKADDIAQKQMRDFFERGGFPAVQNMSTHDWRETLQGYVDTVILKDIIERYAISNTVLLRYLTKTLITNAAAPFSVNKFFNDIKSQGYKVSRATISSYIGYIEDAFLIFRVPLYTESVRIQQTHLQKIYVVDNGLINAYSLSEKELYHKYLENQVYLDLRRQGKAIYYYNTKQGYEVDFVTIDKEGQREIIQVTWDMSEPETAHREQRALEYAETELNIKGRIITCSKYAEQGIA